MSSIWSRIREGVAELRWGDLFELPDASPEKDGGTRPDGAKQVGFTIAVIALGAKMAAADGVVTDSEIRAFHEVFQAPPEEAANVAFFFNLAQRSTVGADSYARQAARLLGGSRPVLEDLLGALFHIARADGRFDPTEDSFLARVAQVFGFDEAEYRRIRAFHVGVSDTPTGIADDPWIILGLEPGTPEDAIRARWRDLVRQNHPDRVMADGLPAEFVSVATTKLARINAAYDVLMPKSPKPDA